jgi:hypothetical protein
MGQQGKRLAVETLWTPSRATASFAAKANRTIFNKLYIGSQKQSIEYKIISHEAGAPCSKHFEPGRFQPVGVAGWTDEGVYPWQIDGRQPLILQAGSMGDYYVQSFATRDSQLF